MEGYELLAFPIFGEVMFLYRIVHFLHDAFWILHNHMKFE